MTYLEGVYWDLDGTIANTELEAHLPAFNNAFRDLGINWHWDSNKYIELLRINGGKNRIAFYSEINKDYFSEEFIIKIHEKKQFHYLEIINSKGLKPLNRYSRSRLTCFLELEVTINCLTFFLCNSFINLKTPVLNSTQFFFIISR